MSQPPTPTAMMRLTKIKFDRVIPAAILQGINNALGDTHYSKDPIITVGVSFSQDGEPITVAFRMGGCSLALYWHGNLQHGPFLFLPADVVDYLMEAGEEALAIVEPLVALH